MKKLSDTPYNFLVQMFAMAVGAAAAFLGMWFLGYQASCAGCLPEAVRAREAELEGGNEKVEEVRKSQVSPAFEKELSDTEF